MADNLPRTYEPLTLDHLAILARLAAEDLDDMCRRLPQYAPLKDAVLSVALCQGGALHWVDGKNGIKDLDVWTLFSAEVGVKVHAKRIRQVREVSLPGLGAWAKRVDLMGRTVAAPVGADPAVVWRSYLSGPAAPNSSPWFLQQKAVVLLEPIARRGEVVWPA